MSVVRRHVLPLVLLVLGIAVAGYQVIYYTGLYRWMAELQQQRLGLSFPLISALPLLIFLIPYKLVAPPPIAKEARPSGEESFDTYAEYAVFRARRQIRWLRIAAPAAALGVVVAYLYAQTLPATAATPVPVDLARLKGPPPLGPVRLTASPDAEHVVSILHPSKPGQDEMVIPLLSNGKAHYFVALRNSNYANESVLYDLQHGGSVTGMLTRGSIDAQMQAQIDKLGVAPADESYVLNTTIPKPRDRPYAIAQFAGLALAVFALLLGIALFRLRKFSAQMAEDGIAA